MGGMLFWRRKMATERLIDGYRKFRRTTFRRQQGKYKRLARQGQSPKVLVIGCSDSRVSPSVVFGAQPGDIFVARNIANIVPPHDPDGRPRSIGAVVEYAVKVLEVTDIVVKGHARCGGVAALVNDGHGLPETDYLKPWVDVAAPARKLFPPNFENLSREEQRLAAELAVIQNSVINLSGFPWVRERMEEDRLRIHGWHFDFESGVLLLHDAESGEWVKVE
jgi:carbonic anhydrase